MLDYLASLRRLLELAPGVIYPAHGPVVSAGVERLRGYLEHRLQREELVLAALRSLGAATPTQLVPPSYPDVQPEVYPLAERSLLAHLGKLVKEGRAQACVSAGNTGALMGTAKFVLKTLPGIDRPAICAVLPASQIPFPPPLDVPVAIGSQ